MKEEIKEAVQTIASHPKVSLGVTAFFTSNLWIDYGAPTIQGIGSIIGLIVVSLIAITKALDLIDRLKKTKDE